MQDLWLSVLGKLDWLLGAIPKAKNINTVQKDFEIDTDARKLDGEPRMAPTLLGGFGQKMIRTITVTIWNY